MFVSVLNTDSPTYLHVFCAFHIQLTNVCCTRTKEQIMYNYVYQWDSIATLVHQMFTTPYPMQYDKAHFKYAKYKSLAAWKSGELEILHVMEHNSDNLLLNWNRCSLKLRPESMCSPKYLVLDNFSRQLECNLILIGGDMR